MKHFTSIPDNARLTKSGIGFLLVQSASSVEYFDTLDDKVY